MPPKKKLRTEDAHLAWKGDEVQLLLEATRDFKTKQEYSGANCKSIKEKCENIGETFSNLLKQRTFSIEKGLYLKSNRFEQNIEKLRMQNGKMEEVE